MNPTLPVIPKIADLPIKIYGASQPEYQAFPCYVDGDGVITARWQLSWKERFFILFKGYFWQQIHTFNQPLQPQLLTCKSPVQN